MGKKRNTNKVTLALPPNLFLGGSKVGGTNSICGGRDGARDLSDVSDLESIHSSVIGAEFADSDGEDDLANMVDSFVDQMEDAQDKRIGTRLKAIDNILLVLNRNYMPDNVEKWKVTIMEIVEKNLKRTTEEAIRVCSLAALISLQLGVDIEDQICEIIGLMRQICVDDAVNDVVRSSCAQAIGICVYLSVESRAHRLESSQTLKSIWAGMKPVGTSGTSLFSSSLASWVLLLERFEPSFIEATIEEMQPKLCTFLESTTVEARISAGEALAVLHEIGVKNIDEDFHFRNQTHLQHVLGELAVDSSKNRAKRDKKLQRLTFRQIYDVICSDHLPTMLVRFNKRETLHLEGCHTKLLYDTLCQLLRSDLNHHLTKNQVLRELFDLGAVCDEESTLRLTKSQKAERMNLFGEQQKQRNICRSKGRAKKNGHKHDFED